MSMVRMVEVLWGEQRLLVLGVKGKCQIGGIPGVDRVVVGMAMVLSVAGVDEAVGADLAIKHIGMNASPTYVGILTFIEGTKEDDSKTDAKQYKQSTGLEDSNSNSDKGGKVDIPELLEDMYEDEVLAHEEENVESRGFDDAKVCYPRIRIVEDESVLGSKVMQHKETH
ncbi:hypothetical protein GUJ93_ZPchr0009g132 [Zizania palustris]|uniref:Uncharacterized protein n=1 Tax=Zizania palustris TaxID=103762 RepID=A0A8J5S572_ZIZPA|nr:hypothetical protein GUJ93_ZPchr0009g132 [Zizania palustris]